MHITSMMSNGYLQPVYDNQRSVEAIEKTQPVPGVSAQEKQVLDREQEFKNAYGPDTKVSTTYRYSVGPDGRRYISGAFVSIETQAEQAKAQEAQVSDSGRNKAGTDEKKPEEKGVFNDDNLTSEERSAVRELQRIEQEVIAHEAAHQSAGGGLAGAASYTYTQGPDGRHYITGGEVSIQMPVSDDPEQTLRDMEQVQRAAMAPANPSSQDFSVAAKAASMAANARQEIAAKNREPNKEESAEFSSGISSVRAGLIFEQLQGEHHEHHEHHAEEEHAGSVMFESTKAYAQNASSRGLWTLRQGFEQVQQIAGMMAGTAPRFNIAA